MCAMQTIIIIVFCVYSVANFGELTSKLSVQKSSQRWPH